MTSKGRGGEGWGDVLREKEGVCCVEGVCACLMIPTPTTRPTDQTTNPSQDVVQRLRRAHSGELHLVYDHCRSHAALGRKNALLLTLLEHISVAASKARYVNIYVCMCVCVCGLQARTLARLYV